MSAESYYTSQQYKDRHYFISAFWDSFCAGGGALFVLILLAIIVPYQKVSADEVYMAGMVASIVTLLQFVINYPHFMVSYQLVYTDYRRKIKQFADMPAMKWRYLNAGIFVPVFLIFGLIYTYQQGVGHQDYFWLGIALHSMQFFVGWHYVKQAFGVFVVHSALNKVYYTAGQRRIFLMNAYAVWLCSWAYIEFTDRFLGPAFQDGYGEVEGQAIPYYPFDIPEYIQFPMLLITIITTMAAAKLIWQLKVKEKKPIAMPAIIGYASMYYLFAFAAILHPEWALLVPVFHSIQYLMFVRTYRIGTTNRKLIEIAQDNAKQVKKIKSQHQMFYGWAFLTGALGFAAIPQLLDAWYRVNMPGLLPGLFFILCFTVFINIHHYFIDNVIWRKENIDVGENLFHWSRQK